nr:transmembrane 6 superfamily member 2 [Anolis sagrei ordinatus]
MHFHPALTPIGLYFFAFPLCYTFNSLTAMESPSVIAASGFATLAFLFAVVYLPSHSQDPLYYVFMVFSFSSGVDAIIALEEDRFMDNFIGFYMREGEPYLTTAYGIMICYWDGVIHYGLYISMIIAIHKRKSYRNIGLYWIGSLTMSLIVFLPGNAIGKYGSEIRPAFLLNIPYLLIPIWAAMRIFAHPKNPTLMTADQIAQEQGKTLIQRPLDLGLVAFLLFAVAFTLFRGLVVLDCPWETCFDYIYQQEPYLRDPVAYPKVQMLVFLFYGLPYFCICIYGLLFPGSTWMPDCALVCAGAIAQAQFAHIGGSLHPRTPFPYRMPETAWWTALLSNVIYALGPHLLAYRCLKNPAFFGRAVSSVEDKKTQ